MANIICNYKKSFCFVLFFLLRLGTVFARDVQIFIEDADLNLPLEGAFIRLQNGTDIVADDNGAINISVADDAIEYISVSYPGYEGTRFLIPKTGSIFTVGLHLSSNSLLENKELIFEEHRQSSVERGIALPKKQRALASEIGIIEDVMSSVKLLPGVGYAGTFNAIPSIRGGEPGDLVAIFDGFYISNPYHWGGAYSIFDPKMVETAALSHGVFSARYGHTVSGILEVAAKKSASYAEADFGISTSAFNFSISAPISKNKLNPSLGGGISFMGKITYWDGYIWLTQGLAKFIDAIEAVNAIKKAPYIRSAALSGNYRFSNDFEIIANGYIGVDGVEVGYKNNDPAGTLLGDLNSTLTFLWDNTIGFFSLGVLYNPKSNMLIKETFGVGIYDSIYENRTIRDYIYYDTGRKGRIDTQDNYYVTTTSIQGRTEFEWEINEPFLFSAGFEEIFKQWDVNYGNNLWVDWPLGDGKYQQLQLGSPTLTNKGFLSSGWSTINWRGANKKYNAELGIRLDHIYFIGEDIDVQSVPVISPRINFNYNIFSDKKYIDSLTLNIGTGLFSTMNENVSMAASDTGLDDFKLAKSWTSIIGFKFDFINGYSFNFETYYKQIFDRAYYQLGMIGMQISPIYIFDGIAKIYGFDIMLQKFEGSKFNGWLSYSFNYVRYKDPKGNMDFKASNLSDYTDWYYPAFHRFNNLNLVINFKLKKRFNLFTRIGFASGSPSFDHIVGNYIEIDSSGRIIKKYIDTPVYSESNRKVFNLPLDLKLSYLFFKPDGKTQGEVYIAIENVLILLLPKNESKILNQQTGNWENGFDRTTNVIFDLPIPMISFGFKWSY